LKFAVKPKPFSGGFEQFEVFKTHFLSYRRLTKLLDREAIVVCLTLLEGEPLYWGEELVESQEFKQKGSSKFFGHV
jgi:hypothetical protein